MSSQDDMGFGSDIFSNPSPEPDSDSGSSDNHSYVVTWVLVPLCILIICAIGLAVLRWRRRRAQQRPHGIAILQRDVEAMGPNRLMRGGNSRWHWVRDPRYQSQRNDIYGSSTTEGLNEFGEAPPAYTPPQKQPDNVELHAVVTSPLAPQMQNQNQEQNALQLPLQPEAAATARMPGPPEYGMVGDGPNSVARTEPAGNQESTSHGISQGTSPGTSPDTLPGTLPGASHGLAVPAMPTPAHVPSS